MDPPRSKSIKKKKKKEPEPVATAPAPAQTQEPQQSQGQIFIDKTMGSAYEWEQQKKNQFIPYNMRSYQDQLLQLLRRIQKFGIDSYVFKKKRYLYTGSWMEYVNNLDDLMLQVNGVNSNEACMKIFNVLFPYPEPLPLGQGDESSLNGFFDGKPQIDKGQDQAECKPETLMENIAQK